MHSKGNQIEVLSKKFNSKFGEQKWSISLLVLCPFVPNGCCVNFPVCSEVFSVCCEPFPTCCEMFSVACEIFRSERQPPLFRSAWISQILKKFIISGWFPICYDLVSIKLSLGCSEQPVRAFWRRKKRLFSSLWILFTFSYEIIDSSSQIIELTLKWVILTWTKKIIDFEL